VLIDGFHSSLRPFLLTSKFIAIQPAVKDAVLLSIPERQRDLPMRSLSCFAAGRNGR